ncbi:MAG: glutamate formimidoyltransferase [Candidatus Coatesbacteria bacterium]|nr:MAG: glutamate formimidoyltransferase [Candidatus Coatesbacteria bacterium]
MLKLVECVPNFSEGRDKAIIDEIAKAITATAGVKLLDVDPGADTNRTVVTFIGTPEGVKDAAFNAIRRAQELIDMRKHKGAHARMGATDVCPFVPVAGVTMDDCVEIAKAVGKRVAEELGIPIYLYENAASRPERRNLATVRQGEYEGLAEKLKDPNWKPDFGEAIFNPRSGATCVGAREFLIAYNVNLNTRDRRKARDIALSIREAGRAKRDENGKIVRDENGKAIKVPGRLKFCKATGWYIDEYAMAQVSMNLTNYKVTPPHLAVEVCREEAQKRGLVVTGTELVGLIPKEAMLVAGRYYLEKQGKCPGQPEKELIRVAAQSMGMSEVAPFDPKEKIIEYQFADDEGSLRKMTLCDFADELSTDSPAPGGGSVAALSGAMSASLAVMVANLTHGKKGYTEHNAAMSEVALAGQPLKDEFLRTIDTDAEAFDSVMAKMRMKKKTPEEKAERDRAIQEATKDATLVPLSVLRKSLDALKLANTVAEKGNVNSLSDAGVSALMGYAAAESAYMNVLINLAGITDTDFVTKTRDEAEELLAVAKRLSESVRKSVLDRLVSKL